MIRNLRKLASPRLSTWESTLERCKKLLLKRYLVAISSAVAAAALTVALEPLAGGKAPLFFLTVAAAVSAGYGGVGAGIVATSLNVAILWSFLQPAALVRPLVNPGLVLFYALGIGASLVLGCLQGAKTGMTRAKERLEIANKRLKERSEALSRANEELKRFAYALAHDLNEPLRGISALTDLLVQRNVHRLDDSSKECAEMIVRKVQRMQSMIKGLLDYAATVERLDKKTMDCAYLSLLITSAQEVICFCG